EVEFEVAAGLAAKQSAGVYGEALQLPEDTGYPYTLTLQLVADGFELADGGAWRREVTATAAEPYPATTFRLRALPQDERVRPRALQLFFSIDGQTIGFALRPIAVVAHGVDQRRVRPESIPGEAVDIGVPTERVAPDLTIRILRDPMVRSALLWS